MIMKKNFIIIPEIFFNYELGSIKSNNFIFCESIWDDELDEYFLIRQYFNKFDEININILTPNFEHQESTLDLTA